MRTKTGPNGSADKHVKEIKRKTRRQFSAEEKIRIVLDGLRGESSISELCRREGIAGVVASPGDIGFLFVCEIIKDPINQLGNFWEVRPSVDI